MNTHKHGETDALTVALREVHRAIKQPQSQGVGSLSLLLLPMLQFLQACSSGGGSDPAPAPPTPDPPPAGPAQVTLDSENPDYVRPDGSRAVVATGHANRNLIATGDGDDSIEALGGDDVLFAGGGADAVDAGEGDDVLIIIGRNVPGEASYRLYTTSDLTSPRGSGLDVSGVVNLNSLQNYAEDDAPGDNFAGGSGADTLIVFGTTDLSRAVLSGIETIIIASDVTITPDQLVGITEIIAGDGSILRLTGEGMVDLSTVAITSLPHLEVAAGVTVNVAAASSLADIEVLSGTGLVQVQMDDATAFAGIQLAEGLRVAVNAASEDAMRVQTVGDTTTVAGSDTANFGGAALAPADVLPSGGLRIEGTASAEQLTGTGNADQITVGTGDTATGGGGADIFNLPATGSAVITDFAVGDRLRLSDLGPEQVTSAVVGSGGQLTITLTDGTTRSFTLQGVSARHLEIADATIGAAAAVDLVFNTAPTSGGDRQFTVDEGAAYVLTSADLAAADIDPSDGPAALTWTLVGAPNFGALEKNAGTASAPNWQPLANGARFTQQELNNGELRYRHDGTENRVGITFEVQVADDGTPSLSAESTTISVSVTPVNDAPVQNDVSFSIAPDAANQMLLGSLAATDADRPPDSLSYRVAPGGTAPTGLFSVDDEGNIRLIDNSLLGAAGDVYTLNVIADDGNGGTDTATVTLRVGGVALIEPGSGYPPPENTQLNNQYDLQFQGLENGRITAASSTTQGITVTRVDDNTIRVSGTVDYETSRAVPIDLTVVADGGVTFVQQIQLPIGDVNERPTAAGDRAFALAEGAQYTLLSADLSATDVDNSDGPGQLTWRLTTAPGNGRLALASSPATAITSFTEEQLRAGQVRYIHDGGETLSDAMTLQVEDGGQLKAAISTIAITVTPVDDAPSAVSLSGGVTSLAENHNTAAAVKVADVSVTDVDGGPRNLQLTGADAGLFMLNNAQTELLLRAGAVLDFETNPQLDVSVRPVANPAAVQALRIAITDINEAPVITAGQRFSVAEAAADNMLVGRVDFDDPESSSSLMFSIVSGNTGGAFAIDNNGRITVADASQLDEDTTAAYTLGVQVVDGTHTVRQDTTITVTNVPQPPSGVALSGAVVPRGEAGWVIGRLSATDPDGGANPVLTWSLSDTSNFEVVNDFLKLKSGVSLNADRSVTVTVTDAQGLTAQQVFSIKPLSEMLGMDSISNRDIGAAALTATGSAGQVLRGRMGSDELVGSVGADIIDGGLHDDVLTGDDGGDVFIYRFDSSGGSLAGIDGDDIILDFNVAEGDKILWIDESTESSRISSLQAFKDAYGTYKVAAESVPDGAPEGSNAFLIQFDTTASPNPLNGISGTFALTVVFEEGVSADLFESGLFNDVDAFIEAFGGPDGFLFA